MMEGALSWFILVLSVVTPPWQDPQSIRFLVFLDGSYMRAPQVAELATIWTTGSSKSSTRIVLEWFKMDDALQDLPRNPSWFIWGPGAVTPPWRDLQSIRLLVFSGWELHAGTSGRLS